MMCLLPNPPRLRPPLLRLTTLLATLLATLLPVTVPAAEHFLGATAADLPPFEQVISTLSGLPEVRAAEQMAVAEAANLQRLQAGPHEWQVRTSLAQRRVDATGVDPANRFHEWEVAVERPLRSAGKADIDGRIGDAALHHAQNAVGDATHEAARLLLRRWFELRRATSERDALARQGQLWEQTRSTVASRVKVGDAAQLDLDAADAAVAQAQARRLEVEAEVTRLRVEFDRAYPQLAGTVPSPGGMPPVDGPGLEEYLARVQQEHHEIAMMENEVERRAQLAERARADRNPDPTIGVRLTSERGGAEHIAGVVLTLPIGGNGRDAAVSAALAETEAARARLEQTRRRVEGEVASLYASRRGLLASWQANRAAADSLQRLAERAQRGYALGETPLADLLATRRQAQEAAHGEVLSRNLASEAWYRLELDTHALWPMDAEDRAAALHSQDHTAMPAGGPAPIAPATPHP